MGLCCCAYDDYENTSSIYEPNSTNTNKFQNNNVKSDKDSLLQLNSTELTRLRAKNDMTHILHDKTK